MAGTRGTDADASLARRAESGVFTVAMALRAGLTRSAIRHRQQHGTWKRLVGACFVLSDEPSEWQRAVGAALTWPDGVVCSRTAARLHGLPVDSDDDVHVRVPHSRASSRGLRAYRVPLSPDEVQRRGVVLLTTRRRTVVDCLARLPVVEAERLLSWVLTRDILTAEDLEEAIAARVGWSGTAQLRRLHEIAVSGALSEGERRLHALLRGAGLTAWLANAPVTLDGQIIARADVLFSAERVIVEFDGQRFHQDFERERRRLNALTLAGYLVLRFTWADVTQRPDAVLAEVRRALGLRSATPARG